MKKFGLKQSLGINKIQIKYIFYTVSAIVAKWMKIENIKNRYYKGIKILPSEKWHIISAHLRIYIVSLKIIKMLKNYLKFNFFERKKSFKFRKFFKKSISNIKEKDNLIIQAAKIFANQRKLIAIQPSVEEYHDFVTITCSSASNFSQQTLHIWRPLTSKDRQSALTSWLFLLLSMFFWVGEISLPGHGYGKTEVFV